jgi:hypothetical protein
LVFILTIVSIGLLSAASRRALEYITPSTAALKVTITSIARRQLFDALPTLHVAPVVLQTFVITVTQWNAVSIIAIIAFGAFVIIVTIVLIVLAKAIDAFRTMIALLVAVTFGMEHALTMIAEMLKGTVFVINAYVIVDALAILTIVVIGTFIVVVASFVIDTAFILADKVQGTIFVGEAVTIVWNTHVVHAFLAPALFIAVAGSSTFTLAITPTGGLRRCQGRIQCHPNRALPPYY